MFAHSPLRRILAPLTIAVGLLVGGTATAAPISGVGDYGTFSGTFAYSQATHAVSVTLTNAPMTLPGGRITGFAFNLPTGTAVTSITYNAVGAVGSSFTLLGGPTYNNSVAASPFGDFDTGAALGGSFLGGGSPAGGVAIGQTGTWTFTLTGDNSVLSALTEASFLSALSTGNGSNHQVPFLVRFRGFDNGGSDKVPNGGNGGFAEAVPEPMSLLTFGLIGGSVLLGVRLRRRKI